MTSIGMYTTGVFLVKHKRPGSARRAFAERDSGRHGGSANTSLGHIELRDAETKVEVFEPKKEIDLGLQMSNSIGPECTHALQTASHAGNNLPLQGVRQTAVLRTAPVSLKLKRHNDTYGQRRDGFIRVQKFLGFFWPLRLGLVAPVACFDRSKHRITSFAQTNCCFLLPLLLLSSRRSRPSMRLARQLTDDLSWRGLLCLLVNLHAVRNRSSCNRNFVPAHVGAHGTGRSLLPCNNHRRPQAML